MISRLEQDSSRRQLRIQQSTSDSIQLEHLETAATILEHPDISQMASARNVIEQSMLNETQDLRAETETGAPHEALKYCLEMNQLQLQGTPFKTGQIRAMAKFRHKKIIIDWRCCQDDSWRVSNFVAL